MRMAIGQQPPAVRRPLGRAPALPLTSFIWASAWTTEFHHAAGVQVVKARGAGIEDRRRGKQGGQNTGKEKNKMMVGQNKGRTHAQHRCSKM